MALTAIHDLEAQQFDVMNAFLNASLEETIYVEMPHGKPSARVYIRVDAAEIAADESNNAASDRLARHSTPENSSEKDATVPGTPRGSRANLGEALL